MMSHMNAKNKNEAESSPALKKGKMDDSKYLPELLAEKDSLDSSFTHAMKLISAGNVTQQIARYSYICIANVNW